MLLDNSTYYTFEKNWVFARRTQIGIEKPYGTNDFLNLNNLPPNSIPVEATQIPLAGIVLRRRQQFAAQLLDQSGRPARSRRRDIPSAGRDCSSTIWRFARLRWRCRIVGNNLGFVFFHDMGNVFDTANHIISGMVRLISRRLRRARPPNSKIRVQLQLQLSSRGHGHSL